MLRVTYTMHILHNNKTICNINYVWFISVESAVIIGCYKLPSDWVKYRQKNHMTNELCQDRCSYIFNFSATQVSGLSQL